MKFLICLAFIACATAATVNVGPLTADFNDFKSLIPTAEIVVIAGEHLLFDSQFRKAKSFLEGSDFKTYWAQAINSPQFAAIVSYLADAGVNVPAIIGQLADKLKLSGYTGTVPTISQRSTSSFLESVFKALPKSKIQALINSKISSSAQFKYFYDQITAPAFNTLVQNLLNAPQLAAGWKACADVGISPTQIISLVKGVFVVS